MATIDDAQNVGHCIEVKELPTAEDIIALIDTLQLVVAERIRRLDAYIEYRERRNLYDLMDINKLKEYRKTLEEIKK